MRRSKRFQALALRTGLAGTFGAGGTIGSAIATVRENLEDKRRRAIRHVQDLREGAGAFARRMPVEAYAAKGVDWGFRNAEGLLHSTAAKHIRNIEEIGAAKIGGLQLLTTEALARRARARHAQFFVQPRGNEDIAKMLEWSRSIDTPKYIEFTRRRPLRRRVSRTVDLSAKRLLERIQNRGEMHQVIFGRVPPSALLEQQQEDRLTPEQRKAVERRALDIVHWGVGARGRD